MRRRSPILEKLADLYAASALGLTGRGARPFSIRFDHLLAEAKCESGDAYANALADLAEHHQSALVLVRHPRSKDIQRIQVPYLAEAYLFAAIGRIAPSAERGAWAGLFLEAAEWSVPAEYAASWRWFCQQRAARVNRGEAYQPFRRKQPSRARALLKATARLLSWKQPALLRTASAQVSGNSKFLERCAATIEQLLEGATGGRVRSFADLQISDNPRSVRFRGPLRVQLHGQWRDFTGQSEATLSDTDLAAVTEIHCTAPRCVTVENATKFHELCALQCGDLFVFTSYPNRATVEFLRRLPPSVAHFHFGDTDPWGFDVLRALRQLTGLEIAPLHMIFRPKEGAPALTDRDCKKLTRLLTDPLLEDVRPELLRMQAAGDKGDFEQETIPVSGTFPYTSEA